MAALRGVGVADRLVEGFGPSARRSPDGDAVDVRGPAGGVMRLSLGGNGLVGGVTSALGRHWSIASREDGKLAKLVTPSGSELALAYDERGCVARVSRDGGERFRAGHDRLGRLERLDFPDGTAAHTDYASTGAAALADPDGHLVAARRDRLGRIERYAYEDSRLVAAEDGAGNVTRFDHGGDRRPRATCFADGGSETYGYDPAGHLARLVSNDGQTLAIQTDENGRPTRIAASDGQTSTFTYDEAGRLVAASNDEVELAWRYDDAGWLVEERQGDVVVGYHHDEVGLSGLTYPSGETISWRRDPDQRIVGLTDWAGGRHEIAYADADMGWRMTGPDGVSSTVRQDRTGLTNGISVERGGRPLWSTAYGYDAEDRLRTQRDSRCGAAAYHYDAESQLVGLDRESGGGERFAYDGAGNRTASSEGAATFDAGNRLVAQGATTYRYDARGALAERIAPDDMWRFRHDGLGRLVSAEDASGRRVTFGYDPLGRRVWKRATQGTVDTLTRFVWAGEQVIRETTERTGDAAGWGGADTVPATARDYLYWPQSWTPLLLREGGVTYRYHTDHARRGRGRCSKDSRWPANRSEYRPTD